MNGDIRPPKKSGYAQPDPNRSRQQVISPNPPSVSRNQAAQTAEIDPAAILPAAQPLPGGPAQPTKANHLPKLIVWGFLVLAIILIGSIGWYAYAQTPVDSKANQKVDLIIKSGMTPSQIASLLAEKELIKSQLAFNIYTRLHSTQNNLLAGEYRLSQKDSLSQIVQQLQKGSDAKFTITFYPGATLYDPTDTKDSKRTDVYTMLRRVGYTDAEVTAALNKTYDHPLFATKPAGTSLEGYVYGETYTFGSDVSAEQVLIHTFDEFYRQIERKQIIQKAKTRGMTLYEAITLGSIIEREVSGLEKDQRQVSQVFHTRLDRGMPLGADATFMYVANQRNIAPETGIQSAYNTRKVVGLPPGPIASPDIMAVEAAVNPAKGSYLYFVSGDDGKTHFSYTQSEHDQNTAKYCTTLCQIP